MGNAAYSGTPLSPDVQGAEIVVSNSQGSARLGSPVCNMVSLPLSFEAKNIPIKSEAGAVLAQGAHIRDIVCIDCHMVLMSALAQGEVVSVLGHVRIIVSWDLQQPAI